MYCVVEVRLVRFNLELGFNSFVGNFQMLERSVFDKLFANG